MNDRQKLLLLLKEKSYEKKRVILSSGKESNFYIDVKQTALHPEGMYLIGKLLFEKLIKEGSPVQAVGGLTLGADPLSVSVSLISYLEKKPISSFFIRKEPKTHGTREWLEGTKNLSLGMSVAILEDVVTTGGSTLKSIERTTLSGYQVKRVIAIVDREEGGEEAIRKAGYVLESLFRKSDFC